MSRDLKKLQVSFSSNMVMVGWTGQTQLVRLEEPHTQNQEQMFEIRYCKTELRLPENVDLKALAEFLQALRRHD